jgi:hypothetical protein
MVILVFKRNNQANYKVFNQAKINHFQLMQINKAKWTRVAVTVNQEQIKVWTLKAKSEMILIAVN